jgi:hypothetical protein
MRIDEISFERPWQLTSNTPYCQFVENEVRKHIGRGLIQVWEKIKNSPDESSNIVATFQHDGAWEVHHIKINTDGTIQSGSKNNSDASETANIGFVSTMKQIYDQHLKRGRKIRIVTDSDLWQNYKTFIDRLVKTSGRKLGEFKPNDVSFDGEPCVSQVIEHRGKFLNGTKIPLI